MRICHITTVHSSKDARIFYRIARPLAERGHEVTVVGSGAGSDELVRMSRMNISIAKSSRLKRSRLALKAALAERSDVYHFHDPEFIPLGFALKALRRSSSVVFDVHEDYPSMMRNKYWIPGWLRPAIAGGMRASNNMAGRFLDGIVTADPAVGADFNRVANGRVLVYYNFPSPSMFHQSEPSDPSTDLVYVGGMSDRTGTFVLLRALAILTAEGLRPTACLAGYTDGEKGWAALNSAIAAHGLENQVECRQRLAYSEVPDWIRRGRIGVVTLQAIPKFMKNIPTKMFEYWSCGLPVVASDLPPIRQFLRDGENGLFFNPSDAEQLADKLRLLLKSPELRAQLGARGLAQINTMWNNDLQVDALIAFYKKIGSQ
jgi:glycosyltransferase involved in cell wall biosynthesis